MTTPEEFSRVGCPNPLIYYLHAAALAHQQLIASVSNGFAAELWSEELQEQAELLHNSSDVFDVAMASSQRLQAMLQGIELWRSHPYRRAKTEPKPIWTHKSARLLDYGTDPSAPTLLIIPSLINRHYIMDLMEDCSFVRLLNKNGLRPALLDWGNPLPDFAEYSMDNYADRILIPAFEELETRTGKPVSVAGYCMGGTLAVGLANLLGSRLDKLALLGAPWDFEAMPGIAKAMRQQVNHLTADKLRVMLKGTAQHFGAIPPDVFQYLFALLAPMQAVQKFSKFSHTDQTSEEARRFVAVEDWLADGPPLPAKVAETVFIDWYTNNLTRTNQWEFGGKTVIPEQIETSTLIIRGERDHIVPTPVSQPLEQFLPNATSLVMDTGHVGMIVSRNAHARIADRLSAFFCK